MSTGRFVTSWQTVVLTAVCCLAATGFASRSGAAALETPKLTPALVNPIRHTAAPSVGNLPGLFAASKRPIPIKKSLHRKLRRRVSSEPAQPPLVVADAVIINLVPRAMAAPGAPASSASSVILRELPPRAPPVRLSVS